MAGTRTAPTVDGSPTFVAVSIKMIDVTGDERTVRIQPVRSDVTDAEIETLVATTEAAINASVAVVNVIQVYAGALLASNANASDVVSVYDNIVLLEKNAATQQAINAYLPSPRSVLLLEGDVVDTSFPAYTAWRDAVDAVLDAAFSAISVRFSERREKNDSTPA